MNKRNKMKETLFLLAIIILLKSASVCAQILPNQSYQMGKAFVRIMNNKIIVNTGKIERQWCWTDHGLLTIAVKDVQLNKSYPITKKTLLCDWNLPGAISDTTSKAKLISLKISEGNDEGFINHYIEVATTIRYEKAHLDLKHVIWVFPHATGVRTQLRIKALAGFKPEGIIAEEGKRVYYGNTMSVPSGQAEYLPLDLSKKNQRRYWGYYNDPGSRHDQSRDMLKEQVVLGYPVFQDEDISWASGVSVDYGDRGVMLVKESPKCVNQQGHNTGSFYTGPQGVKVTGWGLKPSEFVTDRFRECWATWTILYTKGNDGMQFALKQFDRIRYPVFPERDEMIINDTWGPANPGGQQFAKEAYLLKEIPLLADLGIDVLRIDDGWQKNPWKGDQEEFLPRYEDGWKSIVASCKKNQLKLGLWIAVQRAKQKDLLDNLEKAKIVTWKVDFDFLNNREAFEHRFKNIREVMKARWMKTQFSFCPEYNHPRYGWYFAKEYGSIYFQNIQEALPEHLIMVPYNVLRQHWLMSKYFNSNKLQVLLQNPKRVDARYSDAPLHSHCYCFAMGVPFIPVFFQSAQYLDEAGRKELKTFIARYKKYRDEIFACYTFPIGETPSNASWSGFQLINEKKEEGFLLLFRELHNNEASKTLRLKFLQGKTIELENIETNEKSQQMISTEGQAEFNISNPADYKFLKYKIINN